MSDIKEYKCPFCGGRMEFDSTIQKMKCLYCDSIVEMDQFEEESGAATETATETTSKDADSIFQNACSGEWQEGETSNMKIYSCQSCGGEIVAEETTGASSCPYCGNVVVMKGQFAGDLKPDLIIPFKRDKQSAKEAYLSHLKGRAFLPKVFKKENHIDEIQGIYVPFWIFDADVDVSCRFDGEQVSTWVKGDKKYTNTKSFHIDRGGTASFSNIPTDASKKMDDTLMESIEPYDSRKAVPFKSAYLAGYMADRYDVKASERFDRAKERIRNSAIEACRDSIKGYSSVRCMSDNVQVRHSKYRYAMYPVWILNTTWRGKKYVFAMNGQTGKMTGDLPLDKGAFARFVLILGPIIGAILYGLKWAFILL